MSPARSGLLCLLSIDSVFLNLVLKPGNQTRRRHAATAGSSRCRGRETDYMYILYSSPAIIIVPMAMAVASRTIGDCATTLGQNHVYQRSAHHTHRSTIITTVGHIDKHRVPCSDGWTEHVSVTVNGHHTQPESAPPVICRKYPQKHVASRSDRAAVTATVML